MRLLEGKFAVEPLIKVTLHFVALILACHVHGRYDSSRSQTSHARFELIETRMLRVFNSFKLKINNKIKHFHKLINTIE